MRFASVEFAAVVVVVGVELIAWTYILTYRRWLHRAWALLARKPHTTRRAHTIRQLVFNLEMLWIWTPGIAAMIAAVLLGLYLVDIEVWPDVVGIAVFLGTGVSVVVAWGIRHTRLTRRLGLLCPACGVALVEQRGLLFAKAGRCPECATALFGAASDTEGHVARKTSRARTT